MFPFERFIGVIKKCVRNRARPEGSIASAYGTEEVVDFCVDFIDDLKLIGVPESRYKGRLNGKGTAMPTQPGNVYHGQQIPAGYTRVGVEQVCQGWETLELDIPEAMGRGH